MSSEDLAADGGVLGAWKILGSLEKGEIGLGFAMRGIDGERSGSGDGEGAMMSWLEWA
jgi:hypothetical protein